MTLGRWLGAGALALAVVGAGEPARAQQPFLTDDAGVTSPRVWHLEISDQADALRPSARPVLWQSVLDVELAYGVSDRLEASVLVPLVSLFVRDDVAAGVGDSSLGLKYRLTRAEDAAHQFGVSATLELPTGKASRQLGSGLVDYGLTLITQHRVSAAGTVHVNVGGVLVGNTQTGAVGVRTRGGVFVGAASYVHEVSSRLRAGAECVAFVSTRNVGGSSVLWQVGGNLALTRSASLDVALVSGWLEASPRVGLQVGVSLDLNDPVRAARGTPGPVARRFDDPRR